MGRKKSECEITIKNTENKTAPQPGDDIYSSRRNVATAVLDDNAPLVSIFVVAYNNLEKYTKTCVECILKYTEDVDYELILVDNGSSDETFQYFKSVQHPRKKIIRVTKNIGANYGGNIALANAKGRYIAGIANDIYVTKNWLSNMLKCMMSDTRIGMVTPVSDNISNLQSVNLGYKDFDDMQSKAEKHNISNPRKWEERLRLITLGTLFKKECLDMVGLCDYGFFHDFVDDDITFRVRRAGYKSVLCKDVFVSHAGVLTREESDQKSKSLENGRHAFIDKYYGIDTWEDINNYESALISLVNHEERHQSETPEVLGIDVACGTPILEIKNKLRNAGIYHTGLSAFSCHPKYWLDLKTICEGKVVVDRIEYISQHFGMEEFDYILLGKPINLYNSPYRLMDVMLTSLKCDGHLLMKIRNSCDVAALLNCLGCFGTSDNEIVSRVYIEKIAEYLTGKGFVLNNVLAETYDVDENVKSILRNIINSTVLPENTDNIYNRILVRDFAVDITRQKK